MNAIALMSGFKRAPVENATEWPKTFKCRFIQPGLVHYEDMGTVLVDRPALNKMAQTFVGKPVIDEMHKDAKPENFRDIADGVVIRVWTDPVDGWDWCEFLVWDEETMRHCKNREYSVSCAYTPSEVKDRGGLHNNIEYDGEFLNGTYTHLAIVKDPRYERAKIVMNSKGASMFKLFSRKADEVDGKNTILEVEGKEYTVENVAEIIRASAKKSAIADEQVVEIDGKEYTGSELKQIVLNAKKKVKNEEKPEHDHDKEENCGKGCPAHNANDEHKTGDQAEDISKEKELGKKRVAANADDEEEKEDKDEKKKAENALKPVRALGLDAEGTASVINSLAKKDDFQHAAAQEVFAEALNALDLPAKDKGKHLKEFAEAAEMRNNDPVAPTVNTMSDRLALGKSRYGAIKKEAA